MFRYIPEREHHNYQTPRSEECELPIPTEDDPAAHHDEDQTNTQCVWLREYHSSRVRRKGFDEFYSAGPKMVQRIATELQRHSSEFDRSRNACRASEGKPSRIS